LFLLYKGLTTATIKKEAMDKICDTWRKIRWTNYKKTSWEKWFVKWFLN
jgi:hypothetical protein